MLSRRLFLTAVAVLTVATPLVAQKPSEGDQPRVLFVTQSIGFEHDSVKRKGTQLSPSEIAMKQLAQQTGAFTVDVTQNAAADFTKGNLQNYDVVMFYTTGNLPIAEADLDYFFKEWLRQPGHGFIGVHSATDTYHEYKPYWDMIGGTFIDHPWHSEATVTLNVHEPDHPTMKPFGGESIEWTDEIYRYKHWQPEKVRVLMSLNLDKSLAAASKKIEKGDLHHVPVAWVKSYGEGRVYVNNLGHREDTWTKQPFLDSILAGIQWVSGRVDGPAEPNPELSAKQEQLAKDAAGG